MPPEVYVTGIVPAGGGLFEQEIRVDLRIENPNNFEVRLTGMEFDLDLNGKPFARGRESHEMTLPRLGSKSLSVHATTTVIDVLNQIRGLQSLENVGYAIRGRLYLEHPTVESLPFEQEARVGDTST